MRLFLTPSYVWVEFASFVIWDDAVYYLRAITPPVIPPDEDWLKVMKGGKR